MADKKITQLPASTVPLAGTEVLPIVQGTTPTTKQVSVANLTAGRAVSATQYTSTIATGTPPLVVASTTEVANLKAATATLADSATSTNSVKSNTTTGLLQITGPAAASTRVMTTPDANFTVARIDAANSFTADQTLATGNLVIGTSGKGIDFSATPGTGTSELFADYEEGTFTPTISSGFTSTGTVTVDGTYIKVGRTVTCQVRIYSTGTVYISGTYGVLASVTPYAQITGRATGTAVGDYAVTQGAIVVLAGTTAYITPGVTVAMNSNTTEVTLAYTYITS